VDRKLENCSCAGQTGGMVEYKRLSRAIRLQETSKDLGEENKSK